jgi:Domain of unknown function (DUF3854)
MTTNNGTSETPQASAYLQARGITIDTVVQNDIELRPNIGDRRLLACDYRLRLKFDSWEGFGSFHEKLEESIWFPCNNPNGTTESWIVRPFPVLPGREANSQVKFLTSKDGNGYPFIPARTWTVKNKVNKPLLVTEGPVKALAALQAGAYPISVNGVWMIAEKSRNNNATQLHPAFNEFALTGRLIYLAFGTDFETNPSVRQALIRTALLFYKAGAEVKILIWNVRKRKGIDDYLVNSANGLMIGRKFRVGQALTLAGPKDCGKSLLQDLFTVMFGGRAAKPHRYMSGTTPFNGELFGSEHLVMEDDEPSTDIRARRNFGTKIKEIALTPFILAMPSIGPPFL